MSVGASDKLFWLHDVCLKLLDYARKLLPLYFPKHNMLANLINSLLPYNSFGVVPDFPWRARVTACVAATVQEAGIESESASLVVSFPFVGVSVRQLPPNQSAAVLLPPSTKTVPSRSSVIVVTTGFQWYKVPLLR